MFTSCFCSPRLAFLPDYLEWNRLFHRCASSSSRDVFLFAFRATSGTAGGRHLKRRAARLRFSAVVPERGRGWRIISVSAAEINESVCVLSAGGAPDPEWHGPQPGSAADPQRDGAEEGEDSRLRSFRDSLQGETRII